MFNATQNCHYPNSTTIDSECKNANFTSSPSQRNLKLKCVSFYHSLKANHCSVNACKRQIQNLTQNSSQHLCLFTTAGSLLYCKYVCIQSTCITSTECHCSPVQQSAEVKVHAPCCCLARPYGCCPKAVVIQQQIKIKTRTRSVRTGLALLHNRQFKDNSSRSMFSTLISNVYVT